MLKNILTLLFLALPTLAFAQSQRNPCYYTAANPGPGNGCIPVSSANPLPVTGGGGGTVSGNVSNAADGVATTSTNIGSASYNYVWDTTTPGWDRWYGNTNGAFVQGNVANGATDAGNPVKIGAVYNTTQPTLTTGQRSDAQLDSRGNLKVTIMANGSQNPATLTWNGDGVTQATGGSPSSSLGYVFNNSTIDRIRSINGANAAGMGTQAVAIAPTSASTGGITAVVSASAENNHILKASAGNLYSIYATNQTATAGFLVVINAITSPADGAITPLECVPLPASGNASINYNSGPPSVFSTGIVAVVSSGANCFTKTTGTITAFIKGSVQ